MLKPGECLDGRYRIERMLGQGGMGRVMLATHLDLGLPVAIKELSPQSSALRASATRQFLLEARMLVGLNHPALPRVYEVFEGDDGCCMVMDYIEGCTLEDFLTRRGPASEVDVLRWGLALCDVLTYLHEHDPPIIFRDLKPSNVMLSDDGRIKLIDFGIAKELDIGTLSLAHNSASDGFASPEQYASSTDARSDIYSLGATLYCLLTGRVPPSPGAIIAGGKYSATCAICAPMCPGRRRCRRAHAGSARGDAPSGRARGRSHAGGDTDRRESPRRSRRCCCRAHRAMDSGSCGDPCTAQVRS